MNIEKINRIVKVDFREGLKKILPEIFEDNKINFEKLKALLSGEIIEKEDDRFYFNWAGKSKVFKLIQAPAYGTLKPDKEKSVDFVNTENIVLVGENLETLKLLLKPYFGKVKMIYIDPPYNTGKDFIYRDNFKEPVRDYLEKTGQVDSEGNKLTTNTEASGRYHSDWLNFIYPRLFLARSLLREDGVIFVSIDDHEVHHLRMIMDEIFGEENFIMALIWKCRAGGGSDSKYFAKDHEYILAYTKNETFLNRLYIDFSEDEKKKFNLEDERGKYFLKTLERPEQLGSRPNLQYNITSPDGSIIFKKNKIKNYTWVVNEKKFKELLNEDRIVFKQFKDKWMVFRKLYLYENDSEKEQRKKKPRSILDKFGLTRDGGSEIKELFGSREYYSFPKPSTLIKHFISIVTNNKDNIILDFFAGSGTTGQAVWNLNKEDGGNRKFILVQLDEEVQDEETKKEFPTVADICIERLKRVSEKYKREIASASPSNDEKDNTHDFGFKVFRLDKSNFNLKDEFEIKAGEDVEELKRKYLEWLGIWIDEPLVSNWQKIDVVFEIILKEGLNLNSKIEEVRIKNNNFYYVKDVEQNLDFFISLEGKIDKETIEEIRIPNYKNKLFVFLDKALTDDDKINLTSFVRLKVI